MREIILLLILSADGSRDLIERKIFLSVTVAVAVAGLILPVDGYARADAVVILLFGECAAMMSDGIGGGDILCVSLIRLFLTRRDTVTVMMISSAAAFLIAVSFIVLKREKTVPFATCLAAGYLLFSAGVP